MLELPRIEVKVKFVGYLCYLAGKREITVEVEHPASLRMVIENAVETIGGRLKDYLVDPKTGKLWPPPPIAYVNDKAVYASHDSATLREGDEVSLLVPVGGG